MRSLTYKSNGILVGPRPWDEVRKEIEGGVLPRNTPLRFEDNGLWTDYEAVQKSEAEAGWSRVFIRYKVAAFLVANVGIAALGFSYNRAVMGISGLGLILVGAAVYLVDEGTNDTDKFIDDFVGQFVLWKDSESTSGWRTPVLIPLVILAGLIQLGLFWLATRHS